MYLDVFFTNLNVKEKQGRYRICCREHHNLGTLVSQKSQHNHNNIICPLFVKNITNYVHCFVEIIIS